MNIYLLPRQKFEDMRAACELIREFGGRVIRQAPLIPGIIVEAPAALEELLNLLPWT